MSTLAIYRDNAELIEKTEDFETIANQLYGAGVLFERWQADRKLNDAASQEEIIGAYRSTSGYTYPGGEVLHSWV